METATDDAEAAAHGTLAILVTRLHRLELLLTGTSNEHGTPDPVTKPIHGSDTVWARLDALDAELRKLETLSGPSGKAIRDIVALCGCSHCRIRRTELTRTLAATYPDLFSPGPTPAGIPKSEDLSTIASIVLSHASLFPETASRLASLQTLQVPPADQSSKLLSLGPRLDQCKETEASMEEEVRELRERSARCLEWWVKIGVIGMGEMWEDWEKRVAQVERHLVRWERQAKEEQGYL